MGVFPHIVNNPRKQIFYLMPVVIIAEEDSHLAENPIKSKVYVIQSK